MAFRRRRYGIGEGKDVPPPHIRRRRETVLNRYAGEKWLSPSACATLLEALRAK